MSGKINIQIAKIVVSQVVNKYPEFLNGEISNRLATSTEDSVPLTLYRDFLSNVFEQLGGRPILEAGRGLLGLNDPIMFVLLNSDSVPVVIEKEARLGRFMHSRHVVRIVKEFNSGILMEHHSNEEESPLGVESLASVGLHISLFEQMGCSGLSLRFPNCKTPDKLVYNKGEYAEPQIDGGYDKWHFEWESFKPTRQPMDGLDALLLSGETRPELEEVHEIIMAVQQVVKCDLGRTWTVLEVADRAKMSQRSLQRSLAAQGVSFSKVVNELRLTEAEHLLKATELSITEIGYICGFADTSHFSRRFKERFGCPPSAFEK